MARVEVDVRGIEAVRSVDAGDSQDSSVLFNVDVSMSEVKRNPEVLVLDFTIVLETEPAAGKITVKGGATVSGPEKDVDQLLQAASDNNVPPIFMKIYEKIYALLYLICGSLSLPQPSPGLLKLTHLETTKRIVNEVVG